MKKVEKKSINKKGKVVQDKLLIVLIAILVLLSLIILIIKVASRNNLDTESELVTELHNYFNSDDLGNCEGLFTYAEDKIEYKDVNSETRICLAYQKANIEEPELITLKATKKKNTCTEDGMTIKKDAESNTCSVSKIKRNVIDESYKKLYGKDIEDNDSFRIDNLNICYLKDDYYYCGLSETFTYTLGSESIIYRVMQKAVEKGRDIVIYDYFVKINENTCFQNYTTTTVNEKCTDEYTDKKDINYNFMKKYGTEYKHIFKQADDGSYYWVSSEPVK